MNKLITLGILALTLSCSGRSGGSGEAPKPPVAPDPGTDPGAAMDAPQMSVSGKDVKENPKVAALSPTDELNCGTMCGHLAFCNQKMLQKNTSSTALSACVKGCTARRGEADKARWEAMETCMGQHRGDQCPALRGCIETAMSDLQKRLHGKDSPVPEAPMTDVPPEVKP
jgi:hypothetical protein